MSLTGDILKSSHGHCDWLYTLILSHHSCYLPDQICIQTWTDTEAGQVSTAWASAQYQTASLLSVRTVLNADGVDCTDHSSDMSASMIVINSLWQSVASNLATQHALLLVRFCMACLLLYLCHNVCKCNH